MQKNPDIDIIVEPNPEKPGEYLFSMDAGNGKVNQLDFDKSASGMWKWESYRIRFRLKNTKGANLKFSRVKEKVLWAEESNATPPPCPSSQQLDGIFYVAKDNDMHDNWVVVTNTDKDRMRFIFGFNFLPANEEEGPATKYITYDPIGNNQNGGWPRSYAMIAPTTVGGTAIGAAIGALSAPLLNPDPTTATYIWGAVIGGIIGYAIGLVLGKPRAEAAGSPSHA